MMSPLSVENIIELNFAFLKTYAPLWETVFSISLMTDKILSFIKSVSFRPAGEIFIHSKS
jgi:hypothetical protein